MYGVWARPMPWCPLGGCLGALVPWCPPSWHRHVSTGRAGRSRSRSTILGRPRSLWLWRNGEPNEEYPFIFHFCPSAARTRSKLDSGYFSRQSLIMHKNFFLKTWSIAVNVTYLWVRVQRKGLTCDISEKVGLRFLGFSTCLVGFSSLLCI